MELETELQNKRAKRLKTVTSMDPPIEDVKSMDWRIKGLWTGLWKALQSIGR